MRVFVLLLFFAATLLALHGRLPDANSDARGTTVMADHILRTGTLTLDDSTAAFFARPGGGYARQVWQANGRREYYFPIGPVLAAMPLVAAARLAGINVAAHDAGLQFILVGLAIFSILSLIYVYALEFFDPLVAAGGAVAMFFGTLVGPTVSGAFWSMDCEIVITGLVVVLLRDARAGISSGRLCVLGVLLFAGFLCRPTFACVIVCVLLYLAWTKRWRVVVPAGVSAMLLGAFVAFSLHHYGTWLPPYDQASRLSFARAGTATVGLLVSPSRGILVFCPVLLCLGLAFGGAMRREVRALLGMIFGAMALQFGANALFLKWWAGYSFGPRISADLAFLGCLAVVTIVGSMRGRRRTWGLCAAAALLAAGLPVNLAGMFNPYTRLWNAAPSVDAHPEFVFDWRYPQFRATSLQLVRQKCAAQMAELPLEQRAACP